MAWIAQVKARYQQRRLKEVFEDCGHDHGGGGPLVIHNEIRIERPPADVWAASESLAFLQQFDADMVDQRTGAGTDAGVLFVRHTVYSPHNRIRAAWEHVMVSVPPFYERAIVTTEPDGEGATRLVMRLELQLPRWFSIEQRDNMAEVDDTLADTLRRWKDALQAGPPTG